MNAACANACSVETVTNTADRAVILARRCHLLIGKSVFIALVFWFGELTVCGAGNTCLPYGVAGPSSWKKREPASSGRKTHCTPLMCTTVAPTGVHKMGSM